MSTALVPLWFTRRDRWRIWGWVALAGASVILAWAATRYLDAADRYDEAQTARAVAQQRLRDAAKSKPSESAPDAEAAVTIASALRYDWNEVFDEIETDIPPPWSLVSMQVQREGKEIRLVLERPLEAAGSSRSITFPVRWNVTEISEEQGPAGARLLRASVTVRK